MYVLTTNDVNDALAQGIRYLLSEGIEELSRNGPVLVAPGPVTTVYMEPRRRVLFSPTRDANPFFHLMEALWMLSGDNDIEFPCYFAKTYGQYSDDGKTMWDAYGWRWRSFFGWDQLEAIAQELRANPASRRCVLSMWNSMPDFEGPLPEPNAFNDHDIHDDFWVATHGGKAVPCNTQAYFDVRGGRINMTVLCRSNDILLGCYGANAVHFSFLLEYMAMKVGVPVGVCRQVSNNFHLYTDVWPREKLLRIAEESEARTGEVTGPAVETGFDEDLKEFMTWARANIGYTEHRNDSEECFHGPFRTALIDQVAVPMFQAWATRKAKNYDLQNDAVERIAAPDWQVACQEWIQRRVK